MTELIDWFMPSPLGQPDGVDHRRPEFYRPAVEQTPLRRVARPEEVAEVALFLASERSSFITGEVINVGGGYYLGL